MVIRLSENQGEGYQDSRVSGKRIEGGIDEGWLGRVSGVSMLAFRCSMLVRWLAS